MSARDCVPWDFSHRRFWPWSLHDHKTLSKEPGLISLLKPIYRPGDAVLRSPVAHRAYGERWHWRPIACPLGERSCCQKDIATLRFSSFNRPSLASKLARPRLEALLWHSPAWANDFISGASATFNVRGDLFSLF